MALVLGEADVSDLLTMSDAIAAIEAYYVQNRDGLARYHNPIRVKIPAGSLRITAGALLGDGVMGARVGPASGLTGDITLITLFDSNSGKLIAVMGYPYGTLRTGATVGLAAKWLSPTRAAAVALIGTGRNALSLLRGIAVSHPVDKVAVFSRTEANRDAFAEQVEAEFAAASVVSARSAAEAVSNADIVACATNSYEPVVAVSDLKADALVISMGSPAELPQELLLGAEAIFVGSRQSEEQYHHYHSYREDVPPRVLVSMLIDGRLDWGRNVHAIDAVILGQYEPPKAGHLVFKESQGGCGDIALAIAAYRKAISLGRGKDIALTAV